MAPGKVNLDFHDIYTAGEFVSRLDNSLIHEKILGRMLGTTNRTGVRTRFLCRDAGYRTPEAPHTHPYWEELYLIEGDLVSIDAAGEPVHTAPGYASRAPGSMHGPVHWPSRELRGRTYRRRVDRHFSQHCQIR